MTDRPLLTATHSHQQLGIAILRIIVGIVFAAHGAQKLFVYGLAGTSGAFAKMGIPMPGVMGPLVALVEFFGGLALIIGLLTRLAALGLAFDMVGAILLVHLAGGFFLPTGFEYALTQLGATIALALAGPGALAADHALAGRRAGTTELR
jgi:putative oxidoreductase